MTATPSSEARALTASFERRKEFEKQGMYFSDAVAYAVDRAFIAGAEWKGAQDAEEIGRLKAELAGYYEPTYATVSGEPMFVNTRGEPCPACNVVPTVCGLCTDAGDPQTHDPCLGHIEGATSACCGHGNDIGHVIIGDADEGLARLSGVESSDEGEADGKPR